MNTDFDETSWVAERLPEVEDPGAAITDRARLVLLEHISAAAPPTRRRRRVGLGLAALTAAVAAVATLLTIGRAPTSPDARSGSRAAMAPQTRPVRGQPVLLRLADDITRAPAPPGNATLVMRRHTFPHSASFSGYDLYEDNGSYYYGATLDDLRAALHDPGSADKQLGGILMAAAKSANLSPAEAASTIYHASPAPESAPGGSPASGSVAAPTIALRAQLEKLEAARPHSALTASIRRRLAEVSHATPAAANRLTAPDAATVENYVWMNCMDALEGGAGRADIRAGAMLALSAMPDVHVEQTTFQGRPVVQITNTQFSDRYAETLDLDAHTGVLVRMSGGTIGRPDSVDVTYRVSRVTAPSLEPAR